MRNWKGFNALLRGLFAATYPLTCIYILSIGFNALLRGLFAATREHLELGVGTALLQCPTSRAVRCNRTPELGATAPKPLADPTILLSGRPSNSGHRGQPPQFLRQPEVGHPCRPASYAGRRSPGSGTTAPGPASSPSSPPPGSPPAP